MNNHNKKSKERRRDPGFQLPIFFVSEERDYFIENLGMLLGSGMPILSALDAIKTEMRSRSMRRVIDSVAEEIDAGSSLWRALEYTHLVPAYIVSLIRVGEETGRLTENLKVVVIQQQKEREFNSKIRSAMFYPMMVLGVTLVVGIGIAWFILPRLSRVFAELHLQLPWITRALVAVGDFLARWGSFAVPAFLAALFIVLYLLFIFSKTKFIGQGALFFIPGVKKLIREVELGRFGYIFGTLLAAGLPVVDALFALSQATAFPSYQRFYAHLKESIEQGNSFQKGFALYPKARWFIPAPIQQMVISAEQSGHLSETLVKIGEIYEGKTEATTKNLIVILEPVLLVIVWLGVVSVALAVILPIYSLIGGFKR